MTEKITEECKGLFDLILKKLDQMSEQQFDLLQELHSQSMVTATVWESVLISKRVLKRERKKRLKAEKNGLSLKERWMQCKARLWKR